MSDVPAMSQTLTSLATTDPALDRSRYTICQCKKRYIEPDDIYKYAPNKGDPHTKCKVCRGRTASSKFPSHLMVPDHLRPDRQPDASLNTALNPTADPSPGPLSNSTSIEESEESKWLATLSLEQESVLRHSQDIVKRFPPNAILHDLPHATSIIQWQEIESRLRDVYSLERLFRGHDTLQSHYKYGSNTVAPIGLLAVSLNNAAIRQDLPFKFCWIDIPFQGGTAALFMSLNARSLSETAHLEKFTLVRRLQSCSAWQSNILKTSQTITIRFDTIPDCVIGHDGAAVIPKSPREGLLWVRTTIKGTVHGPGMLLFAGGRSSIFRDHCHDDSDRLLEILISHYHGCMSKQVWEKVQTTALAALHNLRNPSDKMRLECTKIVRDRQRRSNYGQPHDDE